MDCANKFYGLTSKDCRRIAYQMVVINKIEMPPSWEVHEMAGRDWMRGVWLNVFSSSTIRWRILKNHLENENVLKSLSDTRWEAHAKATSAFLETYNKIICALDVISEDDIQKGETRREAANLSDKLQEFEFVLMLLMWDQILQTFRKVSKVLQDPEVTLETCANLYNSLVDFLENLRGVFDNLENLNFGSFLLPAQKKSYQMWTLKTPVKDEGKNA